MNKNKNKKWLKLSLVGVITYLFLGYQLYINQANGIQAYKIIVPSFISPYEKNEIIGKYISFAKVLLNPDVEYVSNFSFSKSLPTVTKVYDPKLNNFIHPFDQLKWFLHDFYDFMTFNKAQFNTGSTLRTSYLFMDEKLIFSRTTGCFSTNITHQSNIPFDRIISQMSIVPSHILTDRQQREMTRFKEYMLGDGIGGVQSTIDFVNKRLGHLLSTKRRKSYEKWYSELIVTLEQLNKLSSNI